MYGDERPAPRASGTVSRFSRDFARATGRAAKPGELAELGSFLSAQLAGTAEIEAWTQLCSLLLNLDEVQNLH